MARQLSHLGYAKISHGTKTLMQENITEFICFLMSEANDISLAGKRKAITPQDIIGACARLDLLDFVAPLTDALPHLTNGKRRRGKADEDDGEPKEKRRRRRRVSDEEVARLQSERAAAQATGEEVAAAATPA